MAEGSAELEDIKAHIADHASLVKEIDDVGVANAEAVKEDIEFVFKWLEVRLALGFAWRLASRLA